MMIPADNALDLLPHWSLVVIVLDGYEPRLARAVIDTIAEISDETVFSVMFGVICDEARERISLN